MAFHWCAEGHRFNSGFQNVSFVHKRQEVSIKSVNPPPQKKKKKQQQQQTNKQKNNNKKKLSNKRLV